MSKCQTNKPYSYISELFEPVLSKSVQIGVDTKVSNNIYATRNQHLYVVNNQSFGNPSHKGKAEITKLNIFTGESETYLISPPEDYTKNGFNPSRIWIWSIAVSDSLLLLAKDEKIWIYRFTNSQQYEYLNAVALDYVFQMEICDNNLHVLTNQDDTCKWYKVNLSSFEVKKVRNLELKDIFFMQILPFKVVSVSNNALYFLQQNEPAIEKYSLTGELLANYKLKMPNWNNIPEKITTKLNSIENPTKRNYAFSDYSIFDYNFMFFFHAFSSERFFMMALNMGKEEDDFAIPYFVQIVGDTAFIEPFSTQLDEKEKFGERYFPFSIPRNEENMINTYLDDYVVQINRSANLSWNNKTQKEFKREENLYFRDNEPIEKFETYKFIKNYIPIDSIQFLDYDDEPFSFENMKHDKAIFIISQQPQCSLCIKSIWNFFSNKLMPNVELYQIIEDCSTYLMKKEMIKEVSTYLKAEYTPLFVIPKKCNTATKILLKQKTNPIVVLYDKKNQHVEVFSSSYIIADVRGSITPSFIRTIKNFVGE